MTKQQRQKQARIDRAVRIGKTLAERFFSLRGARVEVHLDEKTLAALLALAAATGDGR